MKSTKIGAGFYRIDTKENIYHLVKPSSSSMWVLMNRTKKTKEYFSHKKYAMLEIK